MSWASIYWDLDHIVQAAREAMESAYAAEMAARSIPAEKPLVPDLNAEVADMPGKADPLKSVEAVLTTAISSVESPVNQLNHASLEKAPDVLEPSLTESLIKARVLENQVPIQPRSPWTNEIEAALREFLRPLSVNLRYEYRFPDVLDEKRSIAAMNRLFKQPVRSDDARVYDLSSRNEIRRKKSRGPGDSQRSVPRQDFRPNDTSGE